MLYAFISYLGRLNEPLIELTTQQSMLQQAVVAGERVFELMDRSQQSYGADDRPLAGGRIDITDLSFAYRADKKVLQHISLAVPSRGFVALVGHTGSGKSTFASLLMGYYPVTRGGNPPRRTPALQPVAAARCSQRRGDGAAGSGGAGRYGAGQRDAGAQHRGRRRVAGAGNGAAGRAGARVQRRGFTPGWASRATTSPSGKNSCWRWRGSWWRRRRS